MRPRSNYSRAHQTQVQEQLGRLIRGALQENATPENSGVALDWCLRRLKEHTYMDTDSAEVSSAFGGLLEKLRVHSQLEAADYLKEQQTAFLRCRLSQTHLPEAEVHAAVLRALLLLARQPTYVPLRMVRSLRAICEGRRLRAIQQRRDASEQAHDRRVLIELELRQVSEAASRAWEEAWAEPDLLPSEVANSETVDPMSPGLSAGKLDITAPDTPRSRASTPRGSGGLSASDEGGLAPMTAGATPSAPRLPKGTLPRQPWQLLPPGDIAGGVPAPVSEHTLVEMALLMLAGHVGDLVEVSSDGDLYWRNLRARHLSTRSLNALLKPLAELGTALRHLRAFVAVLQDLAPPLGDAELRNGVASAVREQCLSLREIAQLHHSAAEEASSRFRGLGDEDAHDVFGLCWQSLGSALGALLESFTAELRAWQAGFYEVGSAVAGIEDNVRQPFTLLQLQKWLQHHRRAILAVQQVLDASLAASSARCCSSTPAEWPEVAAEELINRVAQAWRSEELAGEGDTGSWFGQLWRGALRPVLAAMDQWGTTGEVHDPCGEFRGRLLCDGLGDGDEGRPKGISALLPRAVASSGSHVRSLQAWTETVDGNDGRAERRDDVPEFAGLGRCSSPAFVTAAGPSRRFMPLEAVFEAHVLRPALMRAEKTARPLLRRFLYDEADGLVRHLAAIRRVAFLEHEDSIATFLRQFFDHLRRRAPLREAQDSLAVELNAALAESLETGSATGSGSTNQPAQGLPQRLCGRHLDIRIEPEEGSAPSKRSPIDAEPCVTAKCMQLVYEAPSPLDRILDAGALRAYSAIMALLLRVRYAQNALLEVHVFGFCDRGRRAIPGAFGYSWSLRHGVSVAAARSSNLAHQCDLLRAEIAHFLGCLERYLKIDVIQDTSRTLDRRLQQLAEEEEDAKKLRPPRGSAKAEGRACGPVAAGAADAGDRDLGGPPEPERADLMERARRLHAGYLQQLMQECFLTTEFRIVLVDLEHMVDLAGELRDALADLAAPGVTASRAEGPSSPGSPSPARAEAEMDEGAGAGMRTASEHGGGGTAMTDRPAHVISAEELHARVAAASSRVARMQREFRSSLKYLLQVLRFSVARGGAHRVISFCQQVNFNSFYYDD